MLEEKNNTLLFELLNEDERDDMAGRKIRRSSLAPATSSEGEQKDKGKKNSVREHKKKKKKSDLTVKTQQYA